MQVEVGAVVEGTVTGITKFGAFVSLPDGRSGLVHISEIANTYVNDVNEFLKLGDKVKVRVLAITPDGKINLSIKKAGSSSSCRSRTAAWPATASIATARAAAAAAAAAAERPNRISEQQKAAANRPQLFFMFR